MKNKRYNYSVIALLTAIMLVWSVSCTRDFDELELAKFPNTPEVFIDGFSAGLNYAAFGGSKVTAFDVDEEVKFSGSASMKIEVPDAGDPEGAYAGGVYFTTVGRNLSDYDALTFWAKASKSATIDLVGFGNDLGESKYLVSMQNVAVNSNWKKYIIPIPDASKLTGERGMFYYSEGPEEGLGYTFWVDEVKFEKLGTLAHMKPMILDGEDETESAVNGLSFPLGGLSVSFNMPTGIDQTVLAAPAWFTFSSSNASVASVDAMGLINVLSAGTSVITATLGNEDATGSLTVTSSGDFTHAPAPTAAQEDVISIFSDAYTSVPVEFFNGYWEPYQTTTSADFTVGEDDVLFYNNFNFVGIQFSSPSIDATSMTHLHMDVWIPNAVDPADRLQITVKDMGPDGTLNDGNDPSITYIVPTPMASQSWISVDIDLSGLPSKSKLAQLVLENLGTGLSGFYLDNIYLYGDGGGTPAGPTEAAPTPPARDAADVLSIYGDAYTNLAGTDFPFWGQATVVSDVIIEGNTTLKFAGLNFQGIQFASSQDVAGMEFLHMDFWTANSTALSTFLISTGPVEIAYALTVPTSGWTSVDIPVSSFSGVNLADVIQMKFDGNGDIYLDNIYFYKSGGTGGGPATAAPTPPARDAADVISIYGEAYGAEIGLANVDWDNGSGFVEETIASDKLLKIDFIDFLGTQLNSVVDATAMTHFHMDFWIDDDFEAGQIFNPKWSNHAGGAGETNAFELTRPVGDTDLKKWISIDVPITDFTGDNTRANLTQFLIAVAGKIDMAYVDNIYFYKDGGGSATEPSTAAPTPDEDPADVISLFSDAYTDVTVDTWRTDWSAATLEDVSIAGNAAKKYSALDFVGILTEANQVD
ncbi:MAG: Ig-like domain-containing protein, partial [Marinilabiliaceae bacterium]|nr:Ig-like domain-containing protein [Marinilabiliaceae bacterium]